MRRESYLSEEALGLIINDILKGRSHPWAFEVVSRETLLEQASRRHLLLTDEKLDDWIARGLFSRAAERHQDGHAEMERLMRLLEIHHRAGAHASLSDLYAIPVWCWTYLGKTLGITGLPQVKRALCSWIDSLATAPWEEVMEAMRVFARMLRGERGRGVPQLVYMLTVLGTPKAIGLQEKLREKGMDPTNWETLSWAFQQVTQSNSLSDDARLAPLLNDLSQHLVELFRYVFTRSLADLPDSPDSLWLGARRLALIMLHHQCITRTRLRRGQPTLEGLAHSACAYLLSSLLILRDVPPYPAPVHHSLNRTLLQGSRELHTEMSVCFPGKNEQVELSFNLPLFNQPAQSPPL